MHLCYDHYNCSDNSTLMKKLILIFLSVFLINVQLPASVICSAPSEQPGLTALIKKFSASISVKQIRKQLGRRLTIKEFAAIKLLQWKLKKESRKAGDEKRSDGVLPLILSCFGLLSLILLLFGLAPFGLLGGLAAILGITFGLKAKREDPSDKNARAAVTIGWITLVLYLALIIVIIVAFASIWG